MSKQEIVIRLGSLNCDSSKEVATIEPLVKALIFCVHSDTSIIHKNIENNINSIINLATKIQITSEMRIPLLQLLLFTSEKIPITFISSSCHQIFILFVDLIILH